ncbi:outer membrane beta-barrel protein [Maribacter sp. PR1]|uniref:Outer membrane beta-barrel protein n=1 Tax=Maribacter cobaltidurans TaxID=1178778 RepID=A0ABU7IZC7_9FLAO|nr:MULTISPECIES: outer membrane beta-barrel protein [Maribacter]MDC6390944.1 outer membrane beta-barrel protein [Maribacter sp. PR1]MEE1978336.1 outer membrane beta-barrel protein [Maribacter cobaltidurans]
MKYCISVLLIAFTSFSAFSQGTGLSATISYPITVGDNFLNEYTGFVDVGVQYRFWDLNVVNLGISINASFVGIPNPENEGEEFRGMLIHPTLFGEFPLGRNGEFKPIAGIGYGANRFVSTRNDDGFGDVTFKSTWEGIVLTAGASYDISQRFFVVALFDWAEINRSTITVSDDAFDNRGNIIKIGLGYRF